MSTTKLNKYLRQPTTPITGKKKLTPVLFADSKGNYLEKQIKPGIDHHIKFWCAKSRTTSKGLHWLQQNLAHKIGHLDNISIYIWLGTCDLTAFDPKTRYVTLHPKPEEAVETATQNFRNIAELLRPYANCKLTFIETPPYSIQQWNIKQKHPDTNQFINQDSALSRYIYQLNQNIRTINQELGVVSPSLSVDLSHCQSKNSKNRHKRLADKYNFTLYKDGVHPDPLLAQVYQKNVRGEQIRLQGGQNVPINISYKALLKKLEATQRSTSMEYKQTNGGLVIKADAATFELLKHATVAYFEELPCNIGKATIQRETDSSKNATVQITIKMKEKCGKTYTVNLYLTTCTLMVNGKNPENFGDRDIKEIHKSL
ncbi:unnamed protein product [Mytilus edulis]|uniref:Uncharacterized protein n=1 Tax=Mytilus edulis TaxID=6550 RepID=A0A8S3RHU8_MYTED|nr:unnamed protein product [Mytilus edulis]